jgi:hypothetical protein
VDDRAVTGEPAIGYLQARVQQLSSRDAIAALDLVLQNQDMPTDPDALEEEQQLLVKALADEEARAQLAEVASAEAGPPDADHGDLARATLLFLIEEGQAEQVEHALDHPAPPGQRDPFTLAVVGMVVLALRPTIDIERNEKGRWRFSFKTQPLKDSAMVQVIGKLLSVVSPGKPDSG